MIAGTNNYNKLEPIKYIYDSTYISKTVTIKHHWISYPPISRFNETNVGVFNDRQSTITKNTRNLGLMHIYNEMTERKV